VKIGIISDTHNFFDPRLPELFAGVKHILHAGDIGQPQILLELEQFAPVTAVGGNTDDPGFHYRLCQTLKLTRRKFLLYHIVNPHAPGDDVRARIERERPDVVVFGHSHKPFCEEIGGVLFFNPGYAGKSRFGMERSVAILHCDRELRPEYIRL
jgi:putative phosphoesterase